MFTDTQRSKVNTRVTTRTPWWIFWLNKLGHKSLKCCASLNGATKRSQKAPGTVGTAESALKFSIQQSGIWPRPAAVFQTGIQCKMTISLLLLQPTLLRLGGSPTTFVVEAHGCACSSKLNLKSTFQKSNAKTASTVDSSCSTSIGHVCMLRSLPWIKVCDG